MAEDIVKLLVKLGSPITLVFWTTEKRKILLPTKFRVNRTVNRVSHSCIVPRRLNIKLFLGLIDPISF